MRHVKKAFLGAFLLAGTALVASSPAKAQVVQFEGYVETNPSYGADPNLAPNYGSDPYFGQGYQDPAYDPNYAQGYQDPGYDPNYAQGYQDPGYDPNYAQGYQDPGYDPNYAPGYDQQYYGDYAGEQYGYNYSDPSYYFAANYSPLYDPFYDPYCDYYTPPWGYPPDYCRYQIWNQPVYFGGLWYSGPIYHRSVGGVPWYWINGRWGRDEWRGSRPSNIDWSRHRRWDGQRRNWRDEYTRGDWAGRNTWVGRNYRDNIREARANVLDRAQDRNFRRDFAARNLRGGNGDVGGLRNRGGQFNGRGVDRPGVTNDGRGRGNAFDRRALRDGGSTLVRPNERAPGVRGNPGIERRDFGNRNELAAPNRGQRFENRGAPQRSFAAPERAPRFENRGAAQRSFAAPQRAPRVENRGAQRSFAAPNRAPRIESRAPRAENRGFSGGNRGAFSAPGGSPRVARPEGGRRVEAVNRGGGGGGRAFSGGGGGSPRAFAAGGNRGGDVSRGGGNRAPRGDRGRDRR